MNQPIDPSDTEKEGEYVSHYHGEGRRAEDRHMFMRPAPRIYVAVLFVVMIVAFAVVFLVQQNNFNKQNDDIQQNFNKELLLIQKHNNDQVKLIQSQRWQAAFDTCTDTNTRNRRSFKVFTGIVKKQEANLSAAQKKQAKAALVQYKFLFAAFFPYHADCRARATSVTNVPAPKQRKKNAPTA